MLTAPQKTVLHLLRLHAPWDDGEARAGRFALTYAELEPLLFDRRVVPAHVVACAAARDAASGRVMVVFDEVAGCWTLPFEHGTGDPAALAVRAAERAGARVALDRPVKLFDVALRDVPAHGDERAHRHIALCFAGTLEARVDDGGHDVRMATPDELAVLLGEWGARLAAKRARARP